MKILSWNVNGIRAVATKGFLDWFEKESADIVCVQETKAKVEQLTDDIIHPHGYFSSFHSAQKPGYSSVATFSKREPKKVIYGMGDERFDNEGRVLQSLFDDFVIINAYFPNSQDLGARLPYKLEFCKSIFELCESYRKKGTRVILCGDYNIAHTPIDLAHPKANEKNAGFLPQERAWMEAFTGHGYIDTFRHLNKDPGHYSWWSYRAGARAKDVGWRIDYFCVDPELKTHIQKVSHQNKVMGSDHCPVELHLA